MAVTRCWPDMKRPRPLERVVQGTGCAYRTIVLVTSVQSGAGGLTRYPAVRLCQ
jgi:hypothetical protein